MFDWLSRVFPRLRAGRHVRTIEAFDARDARPNESSLVERFVGNLKLSSGTLVLGDPQYVTEVEVPNIVGNQVGVFASVQRDPSGSDAFAALRLGIAESSEAIVRRKLGEVVIDSAKLIVADKADIKRCWTDTGADRIGVIPLAPNDKVLRLLIKRFKLKTIRKNFARAEVIGPVSAHLANEIEAFLRTFPEYSDYPFMHFYVETNNSFDRVNDMARPWAFLPIGNSPEPLMFACETGHGDGRYDVNGEFSGDTLVAITIAFIEH